MEGGRIVREALKVGVSGVRGIVGDSFTPQIASAFAQAFGAFVGAGPVIVGRDTRPTGEMIQHAIVAGLQSVGCQPVLVGVAPTPTILIQTQALQARGGVAITASHNPAPWNALKFVDRNGLFLSEIRADELYDVYHQRNFHLAEEDAIPEVVTEPYPMDEHFRRVYGYVDIDAIKKARLKVAVDCCNGVGAIHTAPFLEHLGCEVLTIYDKPSKAFEREPEPLPENLKLLGETVLKNKCDVGFAQDPDGDRLAIVNEKGEPIGEDLTLAFAVQQVLSRHKKGPVAINLSTSKTVEDVARALGSEVFRTKIGEINVSETMLKVGAVVGGESNGGVIVTDIHPCRDSYAGMAIVLELMAAAGKRISELRAAMPKYAVVKLKVHIRGEMAPEILRAIRSKFHDQKLTMLDGVHVDFGDSWLHARRSNTEPVIRVTAEAPSSDQAESMAGELRDFVQGMVG